MSQLRARLGDDAANPGLHFLNGEAVTIGGVRIYGCTWYSGLWGANDPKAKYAVRRYIMDFRAPRVHQSHRTVSGPHRCRVVNDI